MSKKTVLSYLIKLERAEKPPITLIRHAAKSATRNKTTSSRL